MAFESSVSGKMLKPTPAAIWNEPMIIAIAPANTPTPTPTPFHPWLDGYSARRPRARAADSSARMTGLCGCLPLRKNGLLSAEMNTIENRNDSSSVMITVTGIARMNSPSTPLTNAIGANTSTVVRVPAIDAVPTRLIAVRTTPIGSSDSVRLASIASLMTIASSTRRPSVRISPNRVIVLRE